MNYRKNNERGVVAVVVAICALLIFSLCALAVDLGNAYARKRDVQTEADLAALAAGASLPHTASSESAILDAASRFASANKTLGQDTTTWNFSDANQTNGYVEFFAANPNKLRVVTPHARVDFGLGAVMGFSGMDVAADATVEIRSPGQSVPFYVAESCSSGLQTLVDTTSGHNNPTLSPTSAQTLNVSFSVSPSTAPAGQTTQITLTASGNDSLQDISTVNLATDGSAYPSVAVNAPFTTHTAQQIVFDLPEGVYANSYFWYVRVGKVVSGEMRYTAESPQRSVTVGSTGYLTCDGAISGNFGILKLSREDSQTAEWDNRNIVQGLQRSLGPWLPSSSVPSDCAGYPQTVEDPYARQAFDGIINCVRTDTGLPSNAASDGLIGKNGVGGRLTKKETTPGCGMDSTDRDAEREVTDLDGQNDYLINNDGLTCFFKSNLTTVASVIDPSASAPSDAIKAGIFESPRFMWVPVVKDDPSRGQSDRYAIVRFQPIFVTGQALSATSTNPGDSATNGISVGSSGIMEIRALMINPRSLPTSATPTAAGTIPYVGVGTRVITLVG